MNKGLVAFMFTMTSNINESGIREVGNTSNVYSVERVLLGDIETELDSEHIKSVLKQITDKVSNVQHSKYKHLEQDNYCYLEDERYQTQISKEWFKWFKEQVREAGIFINFELYPIIKRSEYDERPEELKADYVVSCY